MDSHSSNYLLTRFPRVSVIMADHDPTGLGVKMAIKKNGYNVSIFIHVRTRTVSGKQSTK